MRTLIDTSRPQEPGWWTEVIGAGLGRRQQDRLFVNVSSSVTLCTFDHTHNTVTAPDENVSMRCVARRRRMFGLLCASGIG